MGQFDDLKKGDAVFIVYDPFVFVPTNARMRESVVKSIGRKWITVNDGLRYRRSDGREEFGGGWRLFRSREHLEKMREVYDAWRDFRRICDRYEPPASIVSVEQIATARAILSSGDDWRSVVDAESARKDTKR